MTPVPVVPPTAERRWLAVPVTVLVWLAAAAPLSGQAPPRVGSPGASSEATPAKPLPGVEKSPSETAAPQPIFGLLRPEDGTAAPLPPGTSYDQFLAWISARRGPGYGINSVALTAKQTGETQLEVEAEVRIVVHRSGEWVRVPLSFDEAVLTDFVHEGEGAHSFSRLTGEPGFAWSFDAAGEHLLTLTMLVPIVTRSEETQLALTTPSDAALTTCRLHLPMAADLNAGTGIIRTATVAGASTAVDWVGPGGRIDLTWRPKPVAAELENLTSVTNFLPTVVGKTIQLLARRSPPEGVHARRCHRNPLPITKGREDGRHRPDRHGPTLRGDGRTVRPLLAVDGAPPR